MYNLPNELLDIIVQETYKLIGYKAVSLRLINRIFSCIKIRYPIRKIKQIQRWWRLYRGHFCRCNKTKRRPWSDINPSIIDLMVCKRISEDTQFIEVIDNITIWKGNDECIFPETNRKIRVLVRELYPTYDDRIYINEKLVFEEPYISRGGPLYGYGNVKHGQNGQISGDILNYIKIDAKVFIKSVSFIVAGKEIVKYKYPFPTKSVTFKPFLKGLPLMSFPEFYNYNFILIKRLIICFKLHSNIPDDYLKTEVTARDMYLPRNIQENIMCETYIINDSLGRQYMVYNASLLAKK